MRKKCGLQGYGYDIAPPPSAVFRLNPYVYRVISDSCVLYGKKRSFVCHVWRIQTAQQQQKQQEARLWAAFAAFVCARMQWGRKGGGVAGGSMHAYLQEEAHALT
eukprot:scaffold329167_cov52-Tisochrysis_lutea.AAC.1